MRETCPVCKSKLTLAAQASNKCACGKTYCAAHVHAEHHGCSFDYKSHEQDRLTAQLVHQRIDVKKHKLKI